MASPASKTLWYLVTGSLGNSNTAFAAGVAQHLHRPELVEDPQPVCPQAPGCGQTQGPAEGRGRVVEVTEAGARPERLQCLAGQVRPARVGGDRGGTDRQALGRGPRPRVAVTQGHLRLDQGDLRGRGRAGAGRVGAGVATDLAQLGPGLVPPPGHDRSPGQDQAHRGGDGEIAAIGDPYGARGGPGGLAGLSAVQQHPRQLARHRDLEICRAPGDLVRLPQE